MADLDSNIKKTEKLIKSLKKSLKGLKKGDDLSKDIRKQIKDNEKLLKDFKNIKKKLNKKVTEQKSIIDSLQGKIKEKQYTQATIAKKIIEKEAVIKNLQLKLDSKDSKKIKKAVTTANKKFNYHQLFLNPDNNKIEVRYTNKDWKSITEKSNELSLIFKQGKKELQERLNIQEARGLKSAQNTRELITDLDKKITKPLKEKGQKFFETEISEYGQKGKNFAYNDLKKSTFRGSNDLSNQLTTLDERVMVFLSDETFDDVAARTTQTANQVKSFIRRTSLNTFRIKSATGGDYWEIYDKQLNEFKKNNIYFLDSANKRWDMETYTKMLTRTKLRDVQEEVYQNSIVDVGADLIFINNNGEQTCRYCTPYNNKILSITGKTKGIETVAHARNVGRLFHPNCDCTSSIFDVSGLALDYNVSEGYIVNLARKLKYVDKVVQQLVKEAA